MHNNHKPQGGKLLFIKKALFIMVGVIAVVLGTIGIFVPGLPTTPFILLASWLFYRSSSRLHNWINGSFLGRYVEKYRSGKGVSVLSKLFTILMMTTMSSISVFFVIESIRIKILVSVLCLIGVICVCVFVPGRKKSVPEVVEESVAD